MKNLVVDIGNSRIKVAVVEDTTILHLEAHEEWSESLRLLIKELVNQYSIVHAIVGSTRGEQTEVIESLEGIASNLIVFTPLTPIPIAITYSTPNTLGRDRVAAAVGANEIYGDDDKLIFDLGSAITIDLTTKSGGFEGGFISPGISMRFKALNEYTASLPLCRTYENWGEQRAARSTVDAIIEGVMRGVFHVIQGHIRAFREKNGKNLVIFTGGDAKYFDKRIKNVIFAKHDLVIVGMNRILEYNVK